MARRALPLREGDVIERLRAACKSVGGQTAWARTQGLSVPYVNDVYRGRKAPGDAILRGLGLQRAAPTYVPREPEVIELGDEETGEVFLRATREFA